MAKVTCEFCWKHCAFVAVGFRLCHNHAAYVFGQQAAQS